MVIIISIKEFNFFFANTLYKSKANPGNKPSSVFDNDNNGIGVSPVIKQPNKSPKKPTIPPPIKPVKNPASVQIVIDKLIFNS
ncbi:MAG: hypothetical protein J6C97_00785 [Clostridia bacterium]|nr:hypothetical protein [Clostridia bacterium]